MKQNTDYSSSLHHKYLRPDFYPIAIPFGGFNAAEESFTGIRQPFLSLYNKYSKFELQMYQ